MCQSQATAKIHNNALARDAKKAYKSLVTALEDLQDKLFLSQGDLLTNHEDFKRTVFECFHLNQMDDAESSSEMMAQLNKVCIFKFKRPLFHEALIKLQFIF